jgi:ABC-type bacteriocin/lantibiotic exporter with double-glycine peptidase domain
MMEDNKFSYTYSTPSEKQRRQIEKIKSKYEAQSYTVFDEKSRRLRKMDAHVKNTASAVAIITCAVSSLILGLGMSLVMSYNEMLLGIIIGVIGLFGIIATPYAHSLTFKYQKQKYGEEIMMLADELLSGEASNKEKEEN